MKLNELSQKIKNLIKKTGPQGELRELIVESTKNPADMRLRLQIGKLYFKRKDMRNGIAYYRDVAERYVEDEFYLKAIHVYKEILRYTPSMVEFNEKLGDLFLKLKLQQDATQQYQIAFYYFRNHKQLEDAERIATKMIQAEPEHASHRIKLAEILVSQGREEEAYLEYEKLAEELRKNPEELKQLTEIYEKLIAKNPQDQSKLLELCQLYLDAQLYEKLLKKLDQLKLSKEKPFLEFYQKAQQLLQKPS